MNLRQMLYRTEIRLLPVIASFWVKLGSTPNYEDLIHILCERITDPKNLSKMLNGSEGTDLTAGLKHLSSVGGQEEVSSFEKRFGTLRIAGTEKVLREKYWKNPVSAAEKLFYRGLIFRENRLTDGELKECFILPDDMIPLVVRLTGKEQPLPLQQGIGSMIIRPAAPSETEYINQVYENLPDLFTLAAAQKRDGHPFSHPGVNLSVEHCRFIESLLTESKLFSSSGSPDSEKIRSFMIQNRISARLELIRSWRYSNQYDELSENTLQLEVLESPDYDKRSPRGVILNILGSISVDTWLSLSGFIAEVKKTCPLFLREAFVRHGQIKDSDENDLSGIGSWFQLEGSYLR